MPKIRTHKSTSKRFSRTKGGKGKLVRTRAGQGHLRRNKRASRRRRFYRMKVVTHMGLRDRVRRLLPKNSSLDIRKVRADKTPDAATGQPEAGT
jgi:large subunit ribosomal protein L35